MEHAIQKITQSKYFTPAFNAAIYDGPMRIYFSQSQESEALKIYFHLQQKIIQANQAVCSQLKQMGRNIFVMLYPTVDMFDISFDQCSEGLPNIACEKLGQDFILGVRGPLDNDDYETVYRRLATIMRHYDDSLDFV